MKKVLTILVWFDSALFAVAFAMPAWCLWLSHYFIRRSTYSGQRVPEGAADVLEKISFYFSQAVAPLLFLLLLICLFFYCSRWTQYACHAYFTVATGFLLMFLARWVPVIDLRGNRVIQHPILYGPRRQRVSIRPVIRSGMQPRFPFEIPLCAKKKGMSPKACVSRLEQPAV